MSGDAHVRFCEELGVKFPRPTRLIVLDERHPLRILQSYFTCYHEDRAQLSLDCNAPVLRDIELPDQGKEIAIPQVGGLHHRYRRAD
ncbi:MAG: hypothetical protein IH897_14050 [Planctomycetes bacterium]|nr:hypothetical protein [Planctomycetota bacterium]